MCPIQAIIFNTKRIRSAKKTKMPLKVIYISQNVCWISLKSGNMCNSGKHIYHRLLNRIYKLLSDTVGHLNKMTKTPPCPKDVTNLSRYSSDVHESILIVFGTNVTEKVGNQKVLYIPTSRNQCFCTTWGNRKPESCIFSLKCYMIFFTKNKIHFKISPAHSWTTLQCFTAEKTDCMDAPYMT